MDYVNGIVERITFINEETEFSVIKIKSKGFSDLITAVGNMAAVNVGSSVSLKGEWKHDSKQGKQLNVFNYTETIPATVAGIEKYLGSGFIKGIGPKYANELSINYNYDKNVFNGDVGRITRIEPEDKTVSISFDENELEYDITELDEVTLAYVTTVHKSQGSEYKIVIAPITTQHYMMLQRNLLYTCMTRAKKIMLLIGSVKAIAIAVKNNKISNRNTMLVKRLQERTSLISSP